MNLLILDQFNEFGGAQQCLLDFLPAALERGWRPLVALPGNGPVGAAIELLGIRVAELTCGPFSAGRKSPTDLARFGAQILPLSRQVARLARESDADLIYVAGPRLLPAVAAANARRPVLFHSHHYPDGVLNRLPAGWSLRGLRARVVANCRFVARLWEPFAGRGRLSVVYNGVPAPPNQPPPATGDGPAIGCIGRISPQKGQLRFIAAARLIGRSIPNARFIVQGAPLFHDAESVAYAGRVRASASHLPVEFRDWTPEGASLLSELDLLIVPSHFPEATTRVVLEAFAARVPVLAMRCGGVEEVVDDGVTGFLAVTDRELVELALELLNGDRSRLRRVADAAHARWRCEFTLERYRDRLSATIAAAARGDGHA